MTRTTPLTAAIVAAIVLLAGCGGDDANDASQTTTAVETTSGGIDARDLAGVKSYLTDHTGQLTGATEEFAALAEEYHDLAKSVDYDYARLLAEQREEVSRILEDAKKTWIEANPYYEQVEGVVAGTPSLAEYDIILDAGSSKEEDPESAVPFDLKLSDGRVLEQPGNLFNLTEGMLWGTRPDLTGQAEPDLDGDGKVEFGEALPDALVLASAAEAFERYAAELDTEARAWGPTASDAFTALVVMIPTMSEYFGQWKESRFVQGDAADGDAFNVVSRLSDINDIISGLEVVYDGVEPTIAADDQAGADQTGTELEELSAFIADLRRQEEDGRRFTPEQADQLGSDAQARGEAVAGQVSQHAAKLGIEIQQ
ncbi:MAG TPA: imelysin family protein [Gaiellaceae bacterium]|nr:imelysin family protein [Gaiellaceae bacterium]